MKPDTVTPVSNAISGVKNMRRSLMSLGLAALVVLIWPATALAATTDPLLGTSGNYAVLAFSTITDAGASWITGRMALSPGNSVTGFPPATSGPQDIANGAANQARNDATTAYNNAAAETPFTTLSADLGGMTLVPGIYRYPSSAGLTGTLTLSGGGIYIFQIGSTLTTASSSRVNLILGAQPCDIFWQIGSSATLGGSTAFVGTILAHNNITMVTAATLNGRAFAGVGVGGVGAVSLDTNRIIQPSGCSGGFTTSYPPPAFVAPPIGNILPGTLGDDQSITAAGTTISAAEGQAFNGTVATFNDPDPSSTAAEYAATVAWGDGSSTSAGAITGSAGGPFTVSGSHIYAEERSYNATVTITDTDNSSNTAAVGFTATVADAALTGQSVCPATIQSNFTGATATFTDANPGVHLDDFAALINWGDGRSSAGVITGTNPYTVSGTHVYAMGGHQTITTTITDVGGSTLTLSCTRTKVSCDQEGDNEGQFQCSDPEPGHHGHGHGRDLQLDE